jgi:hypothetical protein
VSSESNPEAPLIHLRSGWAKGKPPVCSTFCGKEVHPICTAAVTEPERITCEFCAKTARELNVGVPYDVAAEDDAHGYTEQERAVRLKLMDQAGVDLMLDISRWIVYKRLRE